MKTLDYEVTDMDIAAGKPGDGRFCPITLALQRVLPEEVSIRVKSSWVIFSREDVSLTVDLPTPARLFLRSFDKAEGLWTGEDKGFIRPFKSSLRFEDGEWARVFGEEE